MTALYDQLTRKRALSAGGTTSPCQDQVPPGDKAKGNPLVLYTPLPHQTSHKLVDSAMHSYTLAVKVYIGTRMVVRNQWNYHSILVR